MHSEAEIRRAAKRAGCRVLELRRVETEYGPVWYGKHLCPSNAATFRFLVEVGQLDLADPVARSMALGFLRSHPKDEDARARAIHKWVKAHVWYVREPKETFQSPTYTVRSGAGDCDDHAILVQSLARNAGLGASIVGLKKNGDVRHAVCRIVVKGKPTWAETTVDAAFGEEPRHAVRRLRVSRSDIHGVSDEIGETFEVKGQRILFHQGTTYRARVRVDAPSFLASKSAIAGKFEDEGFSQVSVWKDPAELPEDWPSDERHVVSGGVGAFTAFLQGAWLRPDETKVRPEPLIALWIHKSPPGERPPVRAAEGSHAWAREMVRHAWKAHFGVEPDNATAQTVQAIALHESGYGRSLQTSDGVPSNNWGSIQCTNAGAHVDCLSPKACPSGCFPHRDHDAEGNCYIACFRQYPEPFLGARDFVRELVVVKRRRGVLQAIGWGNATVIAREMRASGYFEAPVSDYAKAIGRRAREIAAALREPVYVEPTNWVAGLGSLGLVAGGGVLWYRYTHAQ